MNIQVTGCLYRQTLVRVDISRPFVSLSLLHVKWRPYMSLFQYRKFERKGQNFKNTHANLSSYTILGGRGWLTSYIRIFIEFHGWTPPPWMAIWIGVVNTVRMIADWLLRGFIPYEYLALRYRSLRPHWSFACYNGTVGNTGPFHLRMAW